MSYPYVMLGDYIDILSGFAFKSKDFSDNGIPVIKIKNIVPPYVTLEDLSYVPNEIAKLNHKFLLTYNDVLIALTGSHINQMASVVGRIARVKYNTPSLLNQRVGKITVKDENLCDINYVYYFLSQEQIKIALASKAGGAANQANISPSDIKKLIIPFPPIETQRRIADILSAYDDLIENNRKQIKLLEEAAQRLYKEWFVDLRFPGHEHTKIVDGVPEGWEKRKLLDSFGYVRGKSYSSKDIAEKGPVLMVNLKNIRSFGGYNRNAEKYYVGEFKEFQLLSAGDIVMGVTDMTQERRLVGHVAIIPRLHKPTIFSMDLIKLEPKSIPKYFLYSALQYGGISRQIAPLANGVNVLHLKPDAMSSLEMLIPDNSLMEQYQQIFGDLYENIETLSEQCDLATQARDRLLPKLTSGEVGV